MSDDDKKDDTIGPIDADPSNDTENVETPKKLDQPSKGHEDFATDERKDKPIRGPEDWKT